MRRRPVAPAILAFVVLFVASAAGVAQDDPLRSDAKTVNVELILDSSGSMAELLASGESRMDAAKRIVRGVIAGLPEREGVNVGLRIYGHRGDNSEATKAESCRASDLVVPIAGVDKPALIRRVEAMQPTGWTPIAYSLELARADFQPGGESMTNAVVLITDGEERCDPPEEACDAAGALHQADVAVVTHVVGFTLTPEQTETVRCIADEGGGQLFGADDAAGLGAALTAALTGVGAAPVTRPEPPPPLSDIETLVYHQLTAWSGGANDRGEESPLLSDDGQRIAFARAPGTGDPTNPNRIFVMNADGGGEREVDAYTPLCYCGALIDLSANGSRVVSTDSIQLRIADAGGGRELLALDGGEINAVRIAADGGRVFFRVYRDTSIRATSPSQPIQRGIYVINADGSGLRQIVGPDQTGPLLGVPPDQAPFFGASWGFDISANGARLAFAMFDPTGAGGAGESLFGVALDGSGLRRLLGPVSFVTAGAISGDGESVAYVEFEYADNLTQAGVVAFAGGAPRVLTDTTENHPGTGWSLPSGERIQLSFDGSRLLLGSTGLLYDTIGDGVIPLGISVSGDIADPSRLVVDGLLRPSMDAGARRFVYLFQPVGQPFQLARLDLDPPDLGSAPRIAEASVTPPLVLTETRSTATISARVSGGSRIVLVGGRALRHGLIDDNVATFYSTPLFDDGTTGDAIAGDGLFTNNTLTTTCCAEVGPRTIRIKAESVAADGLRHATAVDVGPLAIVADPADVPTPSAATVAPTAGATTTALPLPTIAPTVTPAATATATVTPTPPTIGTAQPTAPAGDFVTPDPAECAVAPRSAESLAALAASPDQAAIDALAAAVLAPGLAIPAGAPADAATAAAVAATYREIAACFNAGNDLAAYALWTDKALRQLQVQPPAAGAPTPVAAEKRLAFRVTAVLVLSDGRIVAVWEERRPISTSSGVQALVQQGDRWLIDETLDLAVGGP